MRRLPLLFPLKPGSCGAGQSLLFSVAKRSTGGFSKIYRPGGGEMTDGWRGGGDSRQEGEMWDRRRRESNSEDQEEELQPVTWGRSF